jgi:parallel beta-helix repeat protein
VNVSNTLGGGSSNPGIELTDNSNFNSTIWAVGNGNTAFCSKVAGSACTDQQITLSSDGTVHLKSTNSSTTAFNVQTTAGIPLFNVDNTNSLVKLDTTQTGSLSAGYTNSFPTTQVLDNFNRANTGPPPSSGWSQGISDFTAGEGLQVSSNTIIRKPTGSYRQDDYWNASTFGPDSEAYVTVTNAVTNDELALFLRANNIGSGTSDAYILYVGLTGGSNWSLGRIDNGSNTALGSAFSQAISNGDSIGVSMRGSRLTAWYKPSAGSWTALATRNDNTYTSTGYIGLQMANSGGTTADNFGGGTTSGSFSVNNTGQVLSRNTADSTTAFQIQNAVGTSLLTVDTSGGSITLAPQGSGTINLNGNTVLSSGKSLKITGDTTANRPSSPSAGMLFYDTSTNQLIQYNGTKWVSDRSTATKIVAASNSSQAVKDAADYVADGTGDQTEINAALTAAAGGRVYLAEGTYSANATILIPNNTTLAGAGKGTLIQLADIDATDNLIENSDTTDGTGIVIQDMSLDGNKAANTGAITQYGIRLYESSSGNFQDSTLQNVSAANFETDGIHISDATRLKLANVVSSSSDGDGLLCDSCTRVQVVNSVFDSNGVNGLEFNGVGSDHTITGNTASGNSGRGFYLAASHTAATGNTAVGNGNAGFQMDGDAGTVSGNTSHGNTVGIDVNGTHNFVTANNISDSGNTDNESIYVEGGADYSIVSNNYITDTDCSSSCVAIRIVSGADKTQLSGNR